MKASKFFINVMVLAILVLGSSPAWSRPIPVVNRPLSTKELQAEVAALKTQLATLQTQQARVMVYARAVSTGTTSRLSLVTAPASTSFGPCSDGGILIGQGFRSFSSDPLIVTAVLNAYQTCTGYDYNEDMTTLLLAYPPRVFFDLPGCQGNMYEWEAAGANYTTDVLFGGVVFASPVDGTAWMVAAGQTPQPIAIQSAIVNGVCGPDTETQLMYAVTPNDVNVSGVSSSIAPGTAQP